MATNGWTVPKLPLNTELTAKHDLLQTLLSQTHPDIRDAGQLASLADADIFRDADTRVFVRCRPILSHEAGKEQYPTVHTGPDGECCLLAPSVNLSGQCKIDLSVVDVDGCFDGRTPNEVMHAATCAPLIDLAAAGGSSSLLCYGQTGSGKTFTTRGLMHLNARHFAQSALFAPDSTTKVNATFLEITSDGVRDLISGNPNVQLLESKTSVVTIQGSTAVPVTSAKQLASLYDEAAGNRATKATLRNDNSSRSHMVIRILFDRQGFPGCPGEMCIVDLAGSESTADSQAHDKTLVNETKFINTSLMTLKECIRARGVCLSTTKHTHIPYRGSDLTLLLRSSFELVTTRPTKTAVITCISPLVSDIRMTVNTLRYASLLYLSPKFRVVAQLDEKNPVGWSRERALEMLTKLSGGKVTTPEVILPEGGGQVLVDLPEGVFVARAMQCGLGEKAAKDLNVAVWKRIIDSRTKARKQIFKPKVEATDRFAGNQMRV